MTPERQHPRPDELLAIRQIAKGIRFTVLLGVLASGSSCAWFFWKTAPKFLSVYHDILGPEARLPAPARFVLQFWPGFVALTVILSLSAVVVALKARNLFTIIVTGSVVFTLQIVIPHWASTFIIQPFQQIIQGLQ